MVHRAIRSAVVVTTATALFAGVMTAGAASAAPKPPPPLRILVTNDDGVGAAGIDTLVQALRKVPGVKVVVIAPAENKSGTGSTTTPGSLTTTPATTASGYPAVSVAGFPADTVIYALEQGGLKKKPDLVMSGINQGQNVGLAVGLSGTIGAAKAAAARGIPALAISQGLLPGANPDFATGARLALTWLKQHRKALSPHKGKKVKVVLDNLNIPSCAAGAKLRGTVEVPVASPEAGGIADPQNCASTLAKPATDVEGLLNGYATITALPIPSS